MKRRDEKFEKRKKRKEKKEHESQPEDIESRLEMLENSDDEADSIVDDSELHQNGAEDATEDLELRYRMEANEEGEDENMRELLPIKTREGVVPRMQGVEQKKLSKAIEEDDEDDDEMMDEIDEDMESVEEEEEEVVEKRPEKKPKQKLTAVEEAFMIQQQQEADKVKIADTCIAITEQPEGKIKSIVTIMYMMDNVDRDGKRNLPTSRLLATASVMEVFKDIIPEYRVGIVDLETQKVKKATLERLTYENLMLTYYKRYLTKLEMFSSRLKKKRFAKYKPSAIDIELGQLAVTCLCELLIAHPYFNYSTNIAQILVSFLNVGNEKVRTTVKNSFVTIFKTDKRLEVTRFLTRNINNLLKKVESFIHTEVVSCLLSLPIKDINLDAEKQSEIKQKKLEKHKSRIVNLSKREKKRKKKLVEVEKELLEAQAEENKQAKNQRLVDIMKYVFTIYFRILKRNPQSRLLSCTLEGLAKFAHMINVEFFHDLIEVLYKLLMEEDLLGYREQLHCVQTVFTILSGQGEILNIDPARFYAHLYKNLLQVHAGKNHEDAESILMTVENVLIKRRKHITFQRHLAFLKRMMILTLQLLHNGSMGCLSVIKTSLQLNNQLDILLDLETTVGSGQYDPNIDDPEYSNANCTKLWELGVLHRHYHPTVKRFAKHIVSGVPLTGNGVLPPELSKL